jgi:penicillin-binding protein 2
LGSLIKTVGTDWYKQRVSNAVFCVMAVFVLLGVRLFYLQVIVGDTYRKLSETNSIRLQKIDPTRGLIFDRKGRLLVDNRPAYALSIILKDASPLKRTLTRLAGFMGLPVQTFMDKISRRKGEPSYKPILLMNDIGRDALAVIEVHRYELPGIVVDVKPVRNYLEGPLSAHLIGYMGEISADELDSRRYKSYDVGDFVGKYGVEKSFESTLRGIRGGRQVEVNARGQVVRVLDTVPAVPGDNLYLTIDSRLQKKAEALLDGDAGAIVAMDPNNGEILAMASSPSFDPNAFVEGMSQAQWQELTSNPFRPLENKAIQGEYPPASTYKIVTALAGLEEGVITADSTFFCPGYYQLGNRVFHCWRRWGHGRIDVVDALAQSCDVFFYQVGQQLGVDRLAWYARACGLGTRTGIRIENEAAGMVPTAAWKRRRFGEPWQAGETLSVAIGQGYDMVTPLQMAVLTSAVANGGVRFVPRIISAVRAADGQMVSRAEPRVAGRLPVSAATLGLVRKGLYKVVNGSSGTARIARIDGISISGKTGTAQVFSAKPGATPKEKDMPLELRDHAWFVAYAPSDAPRIAVAVIVEHGEHGGSAAAPLARDLIGAYLSPQALLAHP